jgi:hypothetical protein
MKRSQFSGLLFYTASLFFLTSCGGSENKEESTTDSNTATATTTSTTPATQEVNTIVTSPQSMMVVTHRVANFAKWIASYDDHDSMRLANGIHSYVIGRGLQDTNAVFVAVKVDDMAKAKAFAKDPSLKKAMAKGGVIGAPTISFTTVTWQDTAQVSTDLRSRSMVTVKDWAAWQKAYTDSKQERMDNGIVDRAYGHDADDDKKVTMVTAVVDTAKAFAYYKSDALKKRREEAGVIGEPKRLLYRVVKRY